MPEGFPAIITELTVGWQEGMLNRDRLSAFLIGTGRNSMRLSMQGLRLATMALSELVAVSVK